MDLFFAVGTSGTVLPASAYVRSADYAGAHTILVNLEPMHPPNPYFKEEFLGPAEVVLPRLLAQTAWSSPSALPHEDDAGSGSLGEAFSPTAERSIRRRP